MYAHKQTYTVHMQIHTHTHTHVHIHANLFEAGTPTLVFSIGRNVIFLYDEKPLYL